MKLTVQIRTETGKKVKYMRKEGLVPAIVYGKWLDTPVLLSCIKNDFIKIFRQAGYSTPIELTGAIDQLVLLQAMQLDPVSDEVLTLDFLAVSRTEKVSASVPVVIIGESSVEKLGEGKIQLVKDTVEVEAFPQDLPSEIQIDVSAIETTNDVIFVKDVTLASTVKVLDDEEQPLVTVMTLSDDSEEEETVTTETAEAPETPAA